MAHLFSKPDRQRARVSSRFGVRTHPITGKRHYHTGTDFALAEGTPVFCPWPGEVLNVASDELNGNYLRIRHGADVVSVYCHLEAFAPDVSPGAQLAEGALLGFVGTTGRSTGPHLHFGVMVRGQWVDSLAAVAHDRAEDL